jgi:hypothetical protein
MKADIVLTTLEHGQLIETVIGQTNVTTHTDYLKLFGRLADRSFGPEHKVRTDTSLFGYVAVAPNGDTVHIQ